MGMPIPEEYGGAGGDTVSYAIAIEELTRIDSSVAITVAAHTSLGTMPIYLFGNEEQKQEWLPRLASGEGLAAFGLTEPDAGSDAGATRTKAELRDGEWIDRRLEDLHHERRHRHQRLRHDHRASPARTRSRTSSSRTGRRATRSRRRCTSSAGTRPTRASSRSTAARCPRGTCSASAGRASASSWRSSTAAASRSRRWASASRRARTTSRSPTRRSGSSSGGRSRSSRRSSSSSPTWRRRSRPGGQLVYRAAWLKDAGQADFALAAAQAKLYTGLLSNRVVNAALQIHGGYGFMEEFAISRLYRDQKILEIGEGTNEVQRMVIAKLPRPLEAARPACRSRTQPGAAPRRRSLVAAALAARLLFAAGLAAPAPPRARRPRRLGSRSRSSPPASASSLVALVSPLDTLADENHLLSVHMAPARADRRSRARADGHRAPRAAARLLPARRACSRRSRATATSAQCSRTLLRPRVAFGLWAANLAIWHIPYALRPSRSRTSACTTSSTSAGCSRGLLVWTLLVDPGSHRRLTRRRPRRARGGDVRGRAGPHRRARLLASRRSIRSTTARTGSRRSPTSSSRAS